MYNITAEGALNGTLVGPGSPHGNVAAGPCPVIASECINNTLSICIIIKHTIVCLLYDLHIRITVLCTYS